VCVFCVCVCVCVCVPQTAFTLFPVFAHEARSLLLLVCVYVGVGMWGCPCEEECVLYKRPALCSLCSRMQRGLLYSWCGSMWVCVCACERECVCAPNGCRSVPCVRASSAAFSTPGVCVYICGCVGVGGCVCA